MLVAERLRLFYQDAPLRLRQALAFATGLLLVPAIVFAVSVDRSRRGLRV